MSQHVFTVRTNLIVFAILMALLALTVFAAVGIDTGPLEIPIALTIALVKAVVIMMYFMHLKFSSKLTWLFAGSGTLWLVILIVFALSDFLSREWASPIVTARGPKEAAVKYFGGIPDSEAHLYMTPTRSRERAFVGDPPVQDSLPAH